MNPEQWLSLKWNGGSTMSDRWLNQSKIIHKHRKTIKIKETDNKNSKNKNLQGKTPIKMIGQREAFFIIVECLQMD